MRVSTPFASPKEHRMDLYQDSIFVSNRKRAGPETMSDCEQGSESNVPKQGSPIPCFSASCNIFFERARTPRPPVSVSWRCDGT